MTRGRSYSDDELIVAVAKSCSWRGVLRELRLTATSAGAIRSVRANADRTGADYGHFLGQRRWSDDELHAAVAAAKTWTEVVEVVGLRGGSAIATVKGHALRLGLDARHLVQRSDAQTVSARQYQPDSAHLRRAGSLLAAAWFTLCGDEVSWPLEPTRYDLLVSGAGVVRRVQVKTTTARAGYTWKVLLSTARGERRTYGPDEIDDFFIIDGEPNYFLIPVAAVGGLHVIHVGAYERYRLTSSLA